MSFFKKMKAKSQYQKDLSHYQARLVILEEETDHVEELLSMATNLDDVQAQADEQGITLRRKKDEHILMTITGGSGLV